MCRTRTYNKVLSLIISTLHGKCKKMFAIVDFCITFAESNNNNDCHMKTNTTPPTPSAMSTNPAYTAAEVVAMIPKQYDARIIDSDFTEAIEIHGNPYIGIITSSIQDIEEDEITIRIRTTGAVITIWKNIKNIHVTIL